VPAGHPIAAAIGVAVDVAVLSIVDGRLSVLLVKMRRSPFEGRWALPGGLIRADETVEAAARRELEEKTGLADVWIEQLYTFSAPRRDPNGRCVSVGFLALIPSARARLEATSKYAGVGFFRVDELPALAFDHATIVAAAVDRLRAKLEYTNAAYSLLPDTFALSELQAVYETVLGTPLDPRNFRKRVLELGLVRETGGVRRTGAHRPARLFRFVARRPEQVRPLLTVKSTLSYRRKGRRP
jgi:8-oxo-dGTP diphosphatase